MQKTGSLQFFKAVGKAAKNSILGSSKDAKVIKGNFMREERDLASKVFLDVKKRMRDIGHRPIRARVKSEKSILGNIAKKKEVLQDDLLGMQTYSKDPIDSIEAIEKTFPVLGVGIKNKIGYKGVNIKTEIKGVPTEIQLSPGILSNMGQQLQHNSYKRPANFTD